MPTLRGILAEGWLAARTNVRAILLIQALAFGLVIAYYQSAAVRDATAAVGPIRDRFGLPLSFVIGFVAGGLLPEVAKLATRQTKRLEPGLTMFIGTVYGALSIQIDLFYRLQGLVFGNGVDAATIAKKLAVDMAIAAPLIFIPFTVGMFLWKEKGFSLRALPGLFRWEVYRDRVMTVQVINWFVWVPALCAIYALPLPLQFPLSSLVEACWSLLLVVMAHRPEPAN